MMQKPVMTTAEQQSHLEELENEFKLLQTELSDTLMANNVLSGKIEQKEQELLQTENSLTVIKEKIFADAEQIELELTSLTDKYEDELTFHQNELAKAENLKKRFQALFVENENIKHSVELLEKQISDEQMDHALTVHEMNRKMRLLRQHMEAKLRKELTTVDVFYQKEAFAGLPEDKKKAMFENAKLKDEVALQGIGMANLGSRLTRQTYNYDICQKEWKLLNKKSNAMREKLCEFTIARNHQNEAQQKIEAEIETLLTEQQGLFAELEVIPSFADYQTQKQELLTKIKSENDQITMWETRLKCLDELLEELKPSTKQEANGHYSSMVFSLDKSVLSTMPSATKRKTIMLGNINKIKNNEKSALARLNAVAIGAEPSGIKPADLAIIISQDASLGEALQPLRGKESYLVKTYGPSESSKNSSFAEPVDQNMVAWVVLKILQIWRQHDLLAAVKPTEARSQSPGVQLLSKFVETSKEEEDDDDSSVEDTWDTVYTEEFNRSSSVLDPQHHLPPHSPQNLLLLHQQQQQQQQQHHQLSEWDSSEVELGSSLFHAASADWFKQVLWVETMIAMGLQRLVPLPLRIPPPQMHLITQSRGVKAQNVFLTALQSPMQSYEIGPPVIINSSVHTTSSTTSTAHIKPANNSIPPSISTNTLHGKKKKDKVSSASAGVAIPSDTPSSPHLLDNNTQLLAGSNSNGTINRFIQTAPLSNTNNNSSKSFLRPLPPKSASQSALPTAPSTNMHNNSFLMPIYKIREAAEKRNKSTSLNAHSLENNRTIAKSTSAINTVKSNLWD